MTTANPRPRPGSRPDPEASPDPEARPGPWPGSGARPGSHPGLGSRTSADSRPGSGRRSRPRGVAHLLGPLVAAFLNGVLPVRLRAWDGSETGPHDAPRVTVRDRDALRHVLARPGELGLSRAYVTGGTEVEGDLTDALRRVWASVEKHGTSVPGPRTWARIARLALVLGVVGPPLPPPVTEARMGGRPHSRERDAAAISHHYDAGNDLYELLLDETMAYSCALWDENDPDQSLADAQRAKLDLICEKLRLGRGDRLLDVGCGWGSLTLHAARRYGARVSAVTLSARQRDHVRARAQEEGLDRLVDVRLLHYRDIEPDTFGHDTLGPGPSDTGPSEAGPLGAEPFEAGSSGTAPFETGPSGTGLFDAVASVEMGEHVGRDAYAPFVRQLHDLLRPGGSLLVQQMSRRGAHPGGGPFIERYIAPDMHMRPLGETVGLLEEAGLEVRGVQAMREHYVRTARAWSDVLERRFDEMVALAGPQTARVWRLYLAGGALAFEEGRMGVDQILARRPGPQPYGREPRPTARPGRVDRAEEGGRPAAAEAAGRAEESEATGRAEATEESAVTEIPRATGETEAHQQSDRSEVTG